MTTLAIDLKCVCIKFEIFWFKKRAQLPMLMDEQMERWTEP